MTNKNKKLTLPFLQPLMAKRIRTDGHLRREEYDAIEKQAERASRDPRAFDPNAKAGTFSKATNETIQKRRIVKINRKRPTPTAPPPPASTATDHPNSKSSSSSSSGASSSIPVNPFAAVSMTTNSNPFASFSFTPTPAAVNNSTSSFASSTSSISSISSISSTSLPPKITLDSSTHAFVLDTFRSRIPKIMDDCLLRGVINSSETAKHSEWLALHTTLSSGPVAPLRHLVERPENALWRKHLTSYVTAGKKLNEIDTFMLENLVYRQLLDITEYWNDTSKDPFQSHKTEALTQALAGSSFQQVAALRSAYYATGSLLSKTSFPKLTATTFRSILLQDLWGNRADLSLSAGKVESSTSSASSASSASMSSPSASSDTLLLADHINQVWSDVFQSGNSSSKNIAFVLDNCGLELCTDLVLAEMLLSSGMVGKVTLYAKEHPVFVSDALVTDVHQHIAALSNYHSTNKSFHLQSYVQSGQLIIEKHAFFTSGYGYEKMKEEARDLYDVLSMQDLVIFKGDANYRRLMNERKWNNETLFSKVVSYLPFSTLAIRTLKYPLSCGLKSVDVTKAKEMFGEEQWDCVGKCGVIHYKK